ncbi:MAG: AMP-binding protein, partial [Alphaproteobacteria bacterium]|nr:AMP-binding protein [Alphaproteobacteria bacterium]
MIHPYSYYLARAARWYPENLAVIEGEKRLSYAELDSRIDALARALVALGVKPGDRVAVLQANCHQFMEALCASARAGAAFVPMLGILSEDDHAYILEDCGAEVLIAPAAELGERARALRQRQPALGRLIQVAGGGGDDYESLLAAHAGPGPLVRGSEDDLAQILYTSGT